MLVAQAFQKTRRAWRLRIEFHNPEADKLLLGRLCCPCFRCRDDQTQSISANQTLCTSCSQRGNPIEAGTLSEEPTVANSAIRSPRISILVIPVVVPSPDPHVHHNRRTCSPILLNKSFVCLRTMLTSKRHQQTMSKQGHQRLFGTVDRERKQTEQRHHHVSDQHPT